MRLLSLNLVFCLLLLSFTTPLGAISHHHAPVLTAQEVVYYHQKKHARKLHHRYSINLDKNPLFSSSQIQQIDQNQLAPIIDRLILHKTIVLNSIDNLIDFAYETKRSSYDLDSLQARIEKYLSKGELIFSALYRAIDYQNNFFWRLAKINALKNNPDRLVNIINKFRLTEEEREKVHKIYAICLNPWRNSFDRQNRLKPKVCRATDDYQKPRHINAKVQQRTEPTEKISPLVIIYRLLMQEAYNIAEAEHLDDMEKIVMAKCVAEQSLKFYTPSEHPLKAIIENHAATSRAPESAIFYDEGICTSFSAITLNVAHRIGLKNQVVLAQNGMHFYLEIKIGAKWYHSHPFNSINKTCDLIEY